MPPPPWAVAEDDGRPGYGGDGRRRGRQRERVLRSIDEPAPRRRAAVQGRTSGSPRATEKEGETSEGGGRGGAGGGRVEKRQLLTTATAALDTHLTPSHRRRSELRNAAKIDTAASSATMSLTCPLRRYHLHCTARRSPLPPLPPCPPPPSYAQRVRWTSNERRAFVQRRSAESRAARHRPSLCCPASSARLSSSELSAFKRG